MSGTVGIIIGIVILIISVILHEVMHGYAAYILGDKTAYRAGRLTLNPIPHIDPLGSIILPVLLILSGTGFIIGWAKPVPYNPYNLLKGGKHGDAIVAFAGPATNIFLAIVFGLLVRFGIGVFPPSFLSFAMYITMINIVLAVFNLIPVPPLDGSKVLFSFLPYRFRHIQTFLERYWFIVIIAVIFLFSFLFAPVFFFFFSLITGIGPGLLAL